MMSSIVEELKFGRFRKATRKNYYTIWKAFNEFFIKLDRKPETWEERLTLFVGFLIKDNKKSSTIRSYVSGIKAVLKDIDVELNENRFLMTSLTKACKLVNDSVRIRLPISRALLDLILRRISNTLDQQMFLRTMYLALFSTMYFGLFRIGEMTSGSHPVKACDVHIAHNKKKMMFVLRTSKTHWTDNKPQVVKIASIERFKGKRLNNAMTFCPFELLRNYVKIRPGFKSIDEPFFVLSDRTPVKPETARGMLKKLISLLGLDCTVYDTHSLRIGRCVDLLKIHNLSIETIKKIGRWRSNAVFDYLSIY